jgi:hypothetical protein
MALAFPNSFDAAVMALVFIPEPAKGVAAVAWVVVPARLVAAYPWDVVGGGFPLDPMFEEVRNGTGAAAAAAGGRIPNGRAA